MARFEIKDDFYLEGKPFKILSGAIHYFRVPAEDWHHSLYNLKALGFNTVETYVPWNMHEPAEGNFNFEGNLVRNCTSFSIYLCRVGIRWFTCMALDQGYENSIV